MKVRQSIITKTDSYKIGGHWAMLLSGTEYVYSYFEPRTGSKLDKIGLFGLQICLQEHLEGKVFDLEDVEYAKKFCEHHFGSSDHFNYKGWKRLYEKHGGILPVEICAVPEGTMLNPSNVMMTIVNTDPEFPWLTSYLETILTQYMWYGSTVLSKSAKIKRWITAAMDRTCDYDDATRAFITQFLLHDFGMRGVSSFESAGVGGAAHLATGFVGTDTIAGMEAAMKYYDADIETLGKSVYASEHNIVIPVGEEGEYEDYFLRLIEKFPDGVLSLVGDTFNIERFLTFFEKAKDKIRARAANGKAPLNRVVVRPDSPRFKGDTPANQVIWILEELWKIFGGRVNNKGFKVLDSSVGTIYGDGLSDEEIKEIYLKVGDAGFCVESTLSGQGGGLLQRVSRDDARFAMKSSAQCINGVWRDTQKKPLDESKSSKKGKLALVKNGIEYETIPLEFLGNRKNELVQVFLNGVITKRYTFKEVRENSNK